MEKNNELLLNVSVTLDNCFKGFEAIVTALKEELNIAGTPLVGRL